MKGYYMNVSRRSALALAGLSLMGLVGVRIAAPTDALAAGAWTVVRLASWDDIPAQSIYMSPYDFALNTAEIECSGDYALEGADIVTATDTSRSRDLSGTCRLVFRDRAIDWDGTPLDVSIEVVSCHLEARPAISRYTGKQRVITGTMNSAVTNRSGQLSLDSEYAPSGGWHECNPMAITCRIRLTRPDETPALGRVMIAFRDVDIDFPENDAYSESVRFMDGFDPEIYVLETSWLDINTSTGRVHENSQGPNYASDPRETCMCVATNDFTFEWRGTQCGTVLFDAVSTTITAQVRKIWKGGSAVRPDTIEVALVGSDGSRREAALSDANGWQAEFGELPLVTSGSIGISYTVEETAVAGFESAVAGNVAGGFTVTNTYVVPTVDVLVDVHFEGPYAEHYLPKEKVAHLIGSDGSDRTLTLTPDGWSGAWADVPLTDDEGNAVIYHVTQNAVPYFEWTVSGDVDSGFHLVDVCTVGIAGADKDAEHEDWV